MIVTSEELEAIRDHTVAEYPREACGVILVCGDERRLLRCRNDQDVLHARDPATYPRDAHTAYHIADSDRLAMIKLENEGFVTAVIYHSHVDAGAYFSPTDKRQALLNDDPMYPDTTYVVVSIVSRRVEAVNAFRWDATARDFRPIDLGAIDPRGSRV